MFVSWGSSANGNTRGGNRIEKTSLRGEFASWGCLISGASLQMLITYPLRLIRRSVKKSEEITFQFAWRIGKALNEMPSPCLHLKLNCHVMLVLYTSARKV